METPRTIYDVLSMLAEYHRKRADCYTQLGNKSRDPRADLLLEHLEELENESARVVQSEIEKLSPDHATCLLSGPTISADWDHAADCRCAADPTFDETLDCALNSDQRLDELLDRIEDCSAALSIGELARRLRELKTTKDQRIAKFTRQD